MKSVTEFWNVHLQKGLKTKAELTAAGKTEEEVSTAIGESHKYEGDKLKHFLAAMEVAAANTEGTLSRIMVATLSEGESAPPKSTKVEQTVYIPEFASAPRAVTFQKNDPKGGPKKKGGGDGRGGGKGPKESPWGLSPEQKAAKKGGGPKPAKA